MSYYYQNSQLRYNISKELAKNRKLSKGNDSILFQLIIPIFCAGLTCCITIIFKDSVPNNKFYMIICYCLSFILLYIVLLSLVLFFRWLKSLIFPIGKIKTSVSESVNRFNFDIIHSVRSSKISTTDAIANGDDYLVLEALIYIDRSVDNLLKVFNVKRKIFPENQLSPFKVKTVMSMLKSSIEDLNNNNCDIQIINDLDLVIKKYDEVIKLINKKYNKEILDNSYHIKND